MRRGIAALVVGLTIAAGVVVPASFAPAAHANASSGNAEAQFVDRVNALRASKGLGPMQVSSELTAIGRKWAGAMAAAGKISHNPDYASWVTSNWQQLGENVGVGPTVDTLVSAFVNSPGHYKNLVEPSFTHIGVGVVFTPDGTMYTSHQFMALRGASAAPVAKPAPAPAPKSTRAPAPAKPASGPRPDAPPRPAAAPTAPAQAHAAPVPSERIVLVLGQLRALDSAV